MKFKKHKKCFCFLSLISVFILTANSSFAASASDWKFSVGGEYLNRISKRSVVLYNSFQVIPIWALDLGSPNFQIVGSSLNYKYAWQENRFRWRTRLVPNATPDRPLYTTRSHSQPETKKRSRTAEFDNFLEYHIPNLSETRIELSQDISVHKGAYLELMQRIIIGSWFYRKNAPMLQPAIFSSIGYGTAKHNEYLYGRGANKADFTNWNYGLQILSPGAIDAFWPTIQISRWQTLGAAKNGSFVEGKKNGTQITALAAFQVF